MPWSVYFKNKMLDAGVTAIGGTIYLSLHTGAPGSTGANEATGGTPAYARKALSLASAAAGAKAMSSSVIFDIPAGNYQYVGYWDASTSGHFLGYDPITPYAPAVQDTLAIASGQFDLEYLPDA